MLVPMLNAMIYGAKPWALTSHAKNNLAAAQTNMQRSMLNIIYQDRKTNIWVTEKTKITYVIQQVRRPKWTWTEHVSRIRDNRWISPPRKPTKGKDLEEDRRDGGETNY